MIVILGCFFTIVFEILFKKSVFLADGRRKVKLILIGMFCLLSYACMYYPKWQLAALMDNRIGSTCHKCTCNLALKVFTLSFEIIGSLSAAAGVFFTCLVWIIYRRKQKLNLFILQKHAQSKSNTEEILRRYQSLTPKRYSYSDCQI